MCLFESVTIANFVREMFICIWSHSWASYSCSRLSCP